MRVLAAPYNEDANEYQTLLYNSLSSDVEFCHLNEIYPFSLVKSVLSKRPDILHLHWLHPFFLTNERSYLKSVPAAMVFVLQLSIIRLLGVSIVWTAHNKINHEKDVPKVDYLVRKIVCRLCDAVHVWNNSVGEEAVSYLDVSRDKLEIIPHGNYSPVYKELDLENYKKKTYLVFGNLRPYKNVERIVKSFKEQDVAGNLIIAGKPHSEEMEEVLIRHSKDNDNIFLDLGFVQKEDLNQYLTRSHCVILASDGLWGSGSKLLAMTKGKMILSYNKGSLAELGSWNIKGENLEQIFQKAEQTGKREMVKAGNKNREIALDYHSWRKVGKKTEKMYKRVE